MGDKGKAPKLLCDLCRRKWATFHGPTLYLCDGCYVQDNPLLNANLRNYLLERDRLTKKLDIEFQKRVWSGRQPRKIKQSK